MRGFLCNPIPYHTLMALSISHSSGVAFMRGFLCSFTPYHTLMALSISHSFALVLSLMLRRR